MIRAKGKLNFALYSLVTTTIIACSNAQFSTTAASAPPGVTITPTPTPGPTTTTTPTPTPTPMASCSSNSTVPLHVSYAGLSNASASINLHNTGDGHYYGNVSLNYTSGGNQYSASYSAPSGNNITIPSLYDNGTQTSTFNSFYNNGQKFSGFFQNSVGAVVVSITSVDSGGCASGNIYFQNFVQTGAIQSPYRYCWFIYNGPFNCRDNSIINKTSTVPGSPYTAIGSFSGLPINQAFQ